MVVGSLALIPDTVESKNILLQIGRVTQSKPAMSDTADFYKLHRKYCNNNALNTNPKQEEGGHRNGAKTNDSPKSPKRITGKDMKYLSSNRIVMKTAVPLYIRKADHSQYSLAVTCIRDRWLRGFQYPKHNIRVVISAVITLTGSNNSVFLLMFRHAKQRFTEGEILRKVLEKPV